MLAACPIFPVLLYWSFAGIGEMVLLATYVLMPLWLLWSPGCSKMYSLVSTCLWLLLLFLCYWHLFCISLCLIFDVIRSSSIYGKGSVSFGFVLYVVEPFETCNTVQCTLPDGFLMVCSTHYWTWVFPSFRFVTALKNWDNIIKIVTLSWGIISFVII